MTKHGLLLEPILPDTGFVGGIAGDPPVLLASGDWEPYLPVFEQQQKLGLETMNCVQFSRLNVMETLANYFGKPINKSDRFLYWASGCTENGNYFSNCDFGLRQHGCCDEPVWPWLTPMDRAEYGKQPPADVRAAGAKLLEDWTLGMLVYVPINLDAMREALKKGPLWFCNSGHAMMIYRIDDAIRFYDTYGTGKGFFPLTYVSEIRSVYIAPFTPKALAPKPMTNFPKDCLVVVVDGRGHRLMNVDNTKLYQDEAGKILLEVMARNARNGVAGTFPVVHVREADIAGVPRVNLKGEPVSA